MIAQNPKHRFNVDLALLRSEKISRSALPDPSLRKVILKRVTKLSGKVELLSRKSLGERVAAVTPGIRKQTRLVTRKSDCFRELVIAPI